MIARIISISVRIPVDLRVYDGRKFMISWPVLKSYTRNFLVVLNKFRNKLP